MVLFLVAWEEVVVPEAAAACEVLQEGMPSGVSGRAGAGKMGCAGSAYDPLKLGAGEEEREVSTLPLTT